MQRRRTIPFKGRIEDDKTESKTIPLRTGNTDGIDNDDFDSKDNAIFKQQPKQDYTGLVRNQIRGCSNTKSLGENVKLSSTLFLCY